MWIVKRRELRRMSPKHFSVHCFMWVYLLKIYEMD
jgi:hypothetical protein